MSTKRWQVWAKHPQVEKTLAKRAQGKLPEMESTKQLVDLVKTAYQPSMKVLDVGCNTGHYLRGLRHLDSQLNYTGIDAYATYINQAKKIFAADSNAHFKVKSVFGPLFPKNPFDITFCCNVLLHLPDFRLPVKNILESTKKVCFIRTLLGKYTTIVQRATSAKFDRNGMPLEFIYQNTWEKNLFAKYIKSLGWKVKFIKDKFSPEILQREYASVKKKHGTRIIDGQQVDGNIIFNWVWVKVTR